MKKFPNDFYYFGHGVHLTDNEIDQHVQAVKKMLKKQERDDPKDFSPVLVATGDTLVIGYRYHDSKRIDVCRTYYEMEYAFKE